MKKTLLILSLLLAFVGSQVSAQTITVTGSSATVSPGAVFNVTIQLSVASTLTDNVTALNLLLATPTTGANSGVGFFTVKLGSANNATFPTANGNGSSSTFNTPRSSGTNNGFTVSTPSNDLGVNAGGGNGQATPFSNVTMELVQFTVAANTPVGVYNFRAATGGFPDSGSFINDKNNTGPSTGGSYVVDNAPTFTITVVPEPSTWAFLGLGSLACVGLVALRRRRSA